MRARSLVAVAMCSLALVGCSDDSSSSKKSTKPSTTVVSGGDDATTTSAASGEGVTTSEGDGTPTSDDGSSPTSTVPDSEFTKVVDGLNKSLDDAGDDVCKVLAAFAETTPTPANPDQTRQAIDLVARALNQLADAAPASAADSAAVIKTTAAKLPDEAAAVGYDPTKVSNLSAMMDASFAQAMGTIQQEAKCNG